MSVTIACFDSFGSCPATPAAGTRHTLTRIQMLQKVCSTIYFSLKKIVTPAPRCVKLFFMVAITRSDELRYANRAKVLACMRASNGQSRKQLANNTQLSAATVTQVTAQLLEEGIIVESTDATQVRVQPSGQHHNGQRSQHSGQQQSTQQSESNNDSTVESGDTGIVNVAHATTLAADQAAQTDDDRIVGTGATRPATDGKDTTSKHTTAKALVNNGTRKSARRGRPQVVLELTPNAAMVATVTINFEWIEITLFDYSGAVLQQQSSPVSQPTLSGKQLLHKVTSTLQRALQLYRDTSLSLSHITVACQGKVSRKHGRLLWSPLSRSEVISIGSHLQSRFKVNVSVDNDCNMIASTLYRDLSHSHREENSPTEEPESGGNFAAVLISYGIGLGFIHDGSILTGSRSSGTELGHMQIAADGPLCRCGKRGCIEAYAADYAIWRRVNGRRLDQLDDEMINQATMQEIFAAAHTRNGIERLALREAGIAIGHGLANLFAIFDSFPTRLVGLDETSATIVAEAINERLLDTGDSWNADIVSVHSSDTEAELVRRGAAMQCLDYVDQQIFSFGSLPSVINN